jgi:hypothetical protein
MPQPKNESTDLSNPDPPTVAADKASAADLAGLWPSLSTSFPRIRARASLSVFGVTSPGAAAGAAVVVVVEAGDTGVLAVAVAVAVAGWPCLSVASSLPGSGVAVAPGGIRS